MVCDEDASGWTGAYEERRSTLSLALEMVTLASHGSHGMGRGASVNEEGSGLDTWMSALLIPLSAHHRSTLKCSTPSFTSTSLHVTTRGLQVMRAALAPPKADPGVQTFMRRGKRKGGEFTAGQGATRQQAAGMPAIAS